MLLIVWQLFEGDVYSRAASIQMNMGRGYRYMFMNKTSEMIHHHGASLSKQQSTHTLLIWHTAGFVTVDQHIHVAKSSVTNANHFSSQGS